MRASCWVVVSDYAGHAKYTHAQQGETSAAMHGTLEEPGAIHLAADLPMAPTEQHDGADRMAVAPDARREGSMLDRLSRGKRPFESG